MPQTRFYSLRIIENTFEAETSTMSLESVKPTVAEAQKPSTDAKQDLASKLLKEATDFGEGVFHGAVEAPVNGVVQIVNHVANTHLPELQLVNEKDVDGTVAGKIGSFVGTAADMIGLTLATGGLGGAGAVATGLRMAAVGAVYSGVLQPSADNSKNFFADRATSAAVGALTFGAMGAASVGLDAAGIFAAPAARSIVGSIGYGALTGAAGGVVNAEATATLKEGKALPSLSEFFGDVASYTAFGGALGAASYGLQHLGNPLQHVKIDNKQLTIYNDRSGNPVRIDGQTPVIDDPSESIKWTSLKSPDGTWTSKAQPKSYADVIPPEVDSVVKSPDGSVDLIGQNETRHYGADGTYQYRDLYQEGVNAQKAADAAEKARTADVVVKNTDNSGSTTFDYTGRLKNLSESTRHVQSNANISYDQSTGDVHNVTVRVGNDIADFTRSAPNTYEARIGDSVYKFDGTIKPVASQPGGKADTIEFKSNDGRTFNFKPGDTNGFVQEVKDNTQLIPGQGGAPVVNVDGAGKMQISRNSNYRIPVVNGKELGEGETAAIKPGDTVAIRADVGDNYPIWKVKPLEWGQTSDGTPQLQNTPLKPNSTVDVQGENEIGGWSPFISSLDDDY
jgi:hypothetical protein